MAKHGSIFPISHRNRYIGISMLNAHTIARYMLIKDTLMLIKSHVLMLRSLKSSHRDDTISLKKVSTTAIYRDVHAAKYLLLYISKLMCTYFV